MNELTTVVETMENTPPGIMHGIMRYDPRQYVQHVGNEIIVDETMIDIFQTFDQSLIPVWKPSIELPPYREQKRLRLDIETTGLDPVTDRIMFIGIKMVQGDEEDYQYITDGSEEIMLRQMIRYIDDHKDAAFLSTYNGFYFDWPFIWQKLEYYGIVGHNFRLDTKETVFRTAQIWSGNPAKYFATRFKDGRQTAIVDLFHQVLAWDFVQRKLDTGKGGRSLKNVPLALGLRKGGRVELSYTELMEAYKTDEGMTLVRDYLKDDLDDTDLIGNMLEPAIWYDQQFHPDWKLQSLSTAGNGSKWNDLLIKLYNAQKGVETVPVMDEAFLLPGEEVQYETIEKYYYTYQDESTGEYIDIKPDSKKRYKGALTFASGGVFHNVVKYDFESLYPHIQLIYGICSRKDPKMFQLAILKYGLDLRLVLKGLKELGTITIEDLNREGTTKVKLNSSYGFTGAGHLAFNDMEAAALITGYGRALFNHVVKLIKQYNNTVVHAIPVSLDTDGFSVEIEPGHEQKLLDYITSQLPTGFRLKQEWHHPLVFIPPDEAFSAIIDPDASDKLSIEGLKKNYVIVQQDGKVKVTGRFRKRDQSQLARTFQPDLLRIYYLRGYQSMIEHYRNMESNCLKGKLDLDMIRVTRKARSNENEVYRLGLVNSDGMVTYYEGSYEKPIRMNKNGKPNKTDLKSAQKIHTVKTNSEPYSIKFYLEFIRSQFKQIDMFVKP